MKLPIVRRSVVIDGGKTSVNVEDSFWSGLKEIAESRGIHLFELLSAIKAQRPEGSTVSPAIRVHVFAHFKCRQQALAGTAGKIELGATTSLSEYCRMTPCPGH